MVDKGAEEDEGGGAVQGGSRLGPGAAQGHDGIGDGIAQGRAGPGGVTIEASAVRGFASLTLRNPHVSLTCVPDLGGKITSLEDLRTGREWLWTSDTIEYRRLPYGTSYVAEADTGGWDECFPTVAACAYPRAPHRGTPLPDHGELWPLAWETRVAEETGTIASTVRGTALPYEFQRTIRLLPDAPVVRMEYRVRNLSDDDLVYIWSAHPLLAVEPGMRLLLPPGTVMRPYSTVPEGLLAGDARLVWPPMITHGDNEIELSSVPSAETGVALKLWSEPLAAGWAGLRAADGQLTFRFDPELVPQVGLWLNAGGWSGTGGEPYFNLGLEPCIGAQDSLERAVEEFGQYAELPGGGERRWWLEVHLASVEGPG